MRYFYKNWDAFHLSTSFGWKFRKLDSHWLIQGCKIVDGTRKQQNRNRNFVQMERKNWSTSYQRILKIKLESIVLGSNNSWLSFNVIQKTLC